MKSSETVENKGFFAICSPNPYLADINEQATEQMLR